MDVSVPEGGDPVAHADELLDQIARTAGVVPELQVPEAVEDYEVGATDHINASLLTSFKSMLDAGNSIPALKNAQANESDDDDEDSGWDDDE